MGVPWKCHCKGIAMAGGTKQRLTDIEVKAFSKKAVRGKKLSDGGGLFLLITAEGSAS
jgi:hypothetical protein